MVFVINLASTYYFATDLGTIESSKTSRRTLAPQTPPSTPSESSTSSRVWYISPLRAPTVAVAKET